MKINAKELNKERRAGKVFTRKEIWQQDDQINAKCTKKVKENLHKMDLEL